MERQSINADIVCTGFGPATAGFLHTLNKAIVDESGQVQLESPSAPGMPLQVICYERADDISFGVSGIVSRAKAIKESLSSEELSQIPMSCPVGKEQTVYLLDPIGASRRSPLLKIADFFLRAFRWIIPGGRKHAFRFPLNPPFMNKHGGYILSMGQFMSYVGTQVMSGGNVQIWSAMPASEPLFDGDKVTGVRLMDQGVDKNGEPSEGYMPGMDVMADLTVAGDGPVGAIGQKLTEKFGLPGDNHIRDWAVGMKAVVDLPPDTHLKPGTVIHTLGFPEPEIFGFFYVLPDNVASLGIFVSATFNNPVKNCYRYMQHWMQHPYLWQYLKGATLKSWGAKSLQESGLRGMPVISGDGFARIGEGSGTTNVLTNSGVDEAWKSGTILAEGVIRLLKEKMEFNAENLKTCYDDPRLKSWLQSDAKKSKKARDGFQKGFIRGSMGMGMTGMSFGLLNYPARVKKPYEHIQSLDKYFKGKVSKEELSEIRKQCNATASNMYDAVMDKAGWPRIEMDGKLFISHQDALLLGGKVQAPGGYADHVKFLDKDTCLGCEEKVCIDICSGQAITPDEQGMPIFDREKCVHCGACMWNCSKARGGDAEKSNIDFCAGTGGLHSAEN